MYCYMEPEPRAYRCGFSWLVWDWVLSQLTAGYSGPGSGWPTGRQGQGPGCPSTGADPIVGEAESWC